MDSVIAEYREFTRQLLKQLAEMPDSELDNFINCLLYTSPSPRDS